MPEPAADCCINSHFFLISQLLESMSIIAENKTEVFYFESIITRQQGYENILNTLMKLLELEKVESEIVFFDECGEPELINSLKGADLFLIYPDYLYKNNSRNNSDLEGFFLNLLQPDT